MCSSITGPLSVFSWASLCVSELASTFPEILRVISVLLNKEFHCRVNFGQLTKQLRRQELCYILGSYPEQSEHQMPVCWHISERIRSILALEAILQAAHFLTRKRVTETLMHL